MYAQKNSPSAAARIALVTAASVLMAFNLNTFVHAGGLIPGGFTGLALLIKESALRFAGVDAPFSIILYILNAAPAAISYLFIGKRFTLFSCLMIALSGLLTDWMPVMFAGFLQPHDTLLSAVFGGLLNALSISLCLFAHATSGGTDFIAIFISEKHGKDAWHHIFAGNCAILILAGCLFELDKALYSIIFQYTTTMGLKALFRGYQRKTLLIITGMPDEIYALIRDQTHHGATAFTGIGQYRMAERVMLYSVVAANETHKLVAGIKKIDPDAFINILNTEQLNGRFYRPPLD
ncbi:MAG: YitT family protein [Desulfovibrio sp.]|jgi:uncharacterized membrane-anchored protein YitT (DUF2179 family)|nr:YitT family protein [Desulfovibrio sp.]